jgi:Family of unknown function (DUF6361)
MGSVLAWLDHDEAERRRMQEVIELFRERDTIDELGIGSVRDAFSNLLFPGTSVLHSRARYFLFVPWIYLDLERQKVSSTQAAARARRDEVRLIHALIEGGEGEGSGVIGGVARERLKQLPSSAYWNGLLVHGIRRYHGSIDRYHRSLDGYYQLVRDLPKAEGDEPTEGVRANWDAGLPPAPERLLESATFDLTRNEALYLRERIHASAPGSLFDVLASRARRARHVGFPWRHPDVAKLPADLAHLVALARTFSEVMHGASLLYNLMLAEARPLPARVEEYRTRLGYWVDEAAVPADWDWAGFWAVVLRANRRISPATRRFVERWFEAARYGLGVADDPGARPLISERERMTKGAQARLHNLRALELWGGSSGAAQLNYRWPNVEQIVDDILKGCTAGGSGNARA